MTAVIMSKVLQIYSFAIRRQLATVYLMKKKSVVIQKSHQIWEVV
jgi:hypothetical protein